MSAMADDGRCISCRFLAKFAIAPDPSGGKQPVEHFEVDREDRAHPDRISAFVTPGLTGRITEGIACHRGAADLAAEVKEVDAFPSVIGSAFRRVLNRDRNCPQWARYIPGFSPHEHLMELERRDLEQLMRRNDRRVILVSAVIGAIAVLISAAPGSLAYKVFQAILRSLGAP